MADDRALVLVGPTAVGKTAVALALAEHLDIEIVSADSRQVYRGLDITTAKPTPRERQRVPHHLLDVIAPGERYSAGRFAEEATQAIAAIRARGRTPVVVGGTGLYVKALIDGLFAEPPFDRPRRDTLTALTSRMDHATLVRWADRLDPGFVGSGGRHRASRAIEMAILTGYPLSWWQQAARTGGTITPFVVRLSVPRAVLHQRINARAAEMVRRGAIEEIAALLADGAPLTGPGMDGIGVREAVDVLQGRLPKDSYADTVALATRQYSKRQDTWFRNQISGDVLALDASPAPDRLAAVVAAAWNEIPA